jgi:hypothetical protein
VNIIASLARFGSMLHLDREALVNEQATAR